METLFFILSLILSIALFLQYFAFRYFIGKIRKIQKAHNNLNEVVYSILKKLHHNGTIDTSDLYDIYRKLL